MPPPAPWADLLSSPRWVFKRVYWWSQGGSCCWRDAGMTCRWLWSSFLAKLLLTPPLWAVSVEVPHSTLGTTRHLKTWPNSAQRNTWSQDAFQPLLSRSSSHRRKLLGKCSQKEQTLLSIIWNKSTDKQLPMPMVREWDMKNSWCKLLLPTTVIFPLEQKL